MIPRQYRVWLKDSALLGLNKTHFDRPEIGRMFPVEILDFESESVEIRTPSRLDFSWSEVEIMECVGLKDTNEKGIYEGDLFICSALTTVYEVRFGQYKQDCGIKEQGCNSTNIGFYILNHDNKIIYTFGHDHYGQSNHMEIIGNIYENKNLLKKE